VEDINLLHALFLLYAIPIVIGFVIICAAFVALALSDPGFAELLLFTAILGLIIGLPEALGRR
jgi:ABC-type transport system involved in cytochrome bd biosynthesis fused ATPase/permease subunit